MAANPFFFLSFLSLLSFLFILPTQCQTEPSPSMSGGNWVLLHSSIGISAMHMQLLRNDKVIMFDRTDFGPSNLSLPTGHCRSDPNDVALTNDCTAHSLLYDIPSNSFRPLLVQTDTWCSSGSVLPNGTLVQIGGFNDGERVVRTFSPCTDDQCDWTELPYYLSVRRWYSSNQILPDGRIIVVGGRKAFTYEFYPKSSSAPVNYPLRFLKETSDGIEENNLYPFLHLLPDGHLFIFANTRSILLDYVKNQVLREFPEIPGGHKRNYPSTGSSVLLPLFLSQSPEAEVMVCGGAPPGAFYLTQQGVYVGASSTCGRLKVTDPNPVWVMEKMPMGRVMPDMLLLPTGDVLILNGAANGTAGWEDAINPVLNPVLYHPYERDSTRRFSVLEASPIPRLYHSAAVVIPDGRILVGGSNPHRLYNFTGVLYPTELSLEAFSPHYLATEYSDFRPRVVAAGPNVSYHDTFTVAFELSVYRSEQGISVTLLAPSFTTHSFAMNQRLLVLNVVSLIQLSTSAYQASVEGPTDAAVAPPGYYLVFVVHVGIPSHGVWVKVG
ncbi:aldehyde oxidase GLOX [Macadamia integrifolia]|uniref:aldehyde oxidase GLOX n=1 Tax=Macadamia integrifolia TaxID=60698 RepID=UPI001C4E9C87|nr:aldehyde oxidase GLOX [Macadamia integrifolia]